MRKRRFGQFAACVVGSVLAGVTAHEGSAAFQGRPAAVSIELEDQAASAKPSGGQVSRQDMRSFGQGWSGHAQLFWAAPAPANAPIRNWPHLSLAFTAPAGTYEVLLHYTVAPDFGTFRIFLEGQPAGDISGYGPGVSPQVRSLGQHALAAGSHPLVITVFDKAGASRGFAVGLDRIELRPVAPGAGSAPGRRVPPQLRGEQGPPQGPSSPGPVMPTPPAVLTRAVCAASPETCCHPKGTASDGCRMVAEGLLEVRIRSYVPPRFTVMGKHSPWDHDAHLANIVSDVTVDGPYKVWPGCRFNVTEARNTIDDSKTILEKAGALLEAWLSQWSGGVETAKTFVSLAVANEVCKIVDDSQSCRDTLAPIVKTGINLGLASLGVPPGIPDIRQLREQGIRYIAAEAASYALGDPAILKQLPVDPKTRELLYKKLYDIALGVLSKELNKVIPSPNFTAENPATWGHLEPAYAPHNAHVYIEVRIKPAEYSKYLHFIAVNPGHKWTPLYLHDLNRVYASVLGIEVPTFIPADGIIIPIELKPFDVAEDTADDAKAQIPGVQVSRKWLQGKFGISAADGLVRAQLNYKPRIDGSYGASDWDLFYEAFQKSRFRLLTPVGTKGVLDWVTDWTATVGVVRDADVGFLSVTKSGQLQNYFGRIDPAPRCDGKAPVVYSK